MSSRVLKRALPASLTALGMSIALLCWTQAPAVAKEKGRVFKSLEAFADAVNLALTAQACMAATKGQARDMNELRQWWEDEVAGKHGPGGGTGGPPAQISKQQYEDFFFGRIYVGDRMAKLLAVATGNLDTNRRDKETVALVTLWAGNMPRGETRLYAMKSDRNGYRIMRQYAMPGGESFWHDSWKEAEGLPGRLRPPPLLQLVDFDGDGVDEILLAPHMSGRGMHECSLSILGLSAGRLVKQFDTTERTCALNTPPWSPPLWFYPEGASMAKYNDSGSAARVSFTRRPGGRRLDIEITRYAWYTHESESRWSAVLRGRIPADRTQRFVFSYTQSRGWALAQKGPLQAAILH